MKLFSLLSLCSLLILVPSCCRQKSCCPTTATYCDTQPATPAPYAVAEEAPVVMPAAAPAQVMPAPVEELEDYEALDELEEPKKEEALAADKEALDIEEAVEAEAEKMAAEKEALEDEEAEKAEKAPEKDLAEEEAAEATEEAEKIPADKEGLEDLELDETSETK